ncbi:MAG TPA: glycosyltransferase family 2 protein [Pyrinomonadaceae bacterium]|nr:glycosyltransferase family 2 protein [Pyrinomonadaceae bacterium]
MIAELCIIVINWNSGDLLTKCVRSVVASRPALPYEVLVIDNGSFDNSLQLLSQDETGASLLQQQRLRIVENSDNKGFGCANNQAFKLTDAPFCFLLNPDTEVSPGAIDRLVRTLQSDACVAACGPRILNSDGSVQSSVWRNPPAVWDTLLSQLKLYRLLPRRLRGELLLGGHWLHDRRREVRMLSGAAMLVRRSVIEQIGGFDERFYLYAEDCEWCLRIVRAGWKLMFEPEAVIRHHGASSTLKRWDQLQKLRIQLDASYLYQKLSLPRRQLVANHLASYVISSAQDIWRRSRGIDAPEVRSARAIYWELFRRALNDKPAPT